MRLNSLPAMLFISLVLLVCYVPAVVTDITTKDLQICFHWKLQLDKLILSCKVRNLIFPVAIFDPSGNEMGRCFSFPPPPICDAHHQNALMSLNKITSEVVFTISETMDLQVNGNWTCRHGKSRDEATVNVFVLDKTDNKYHLQLFLGYCAISWISTYIVIRFLTSFIDLMRQSKVTIEQSLFRKCLSGKKFANKLIPVTFQVLFIMVAAVILLGFSPVGNKENSMPECFSVGILLGLLMYIVMVIRVESKFFKAKPEQHNSPENAELHTEFAGVELSTN